MNKKTENQKGLVALTSAIVVAVIIMAITLSLSYTGFSARFNVLDLGHKEKTLSLAEACANVASLKLVADQEYSGDEIVPVGDFSCEILPITKENGEVTIRTRAIFPGNTASSPVTNLVVVLEETSFETVSWEEVPNHL